MLTGGVYVGANVRSTRRRPGLAAIVVASLGIGVGVAATVLEIADDLAFRPLPFRQQADLVVLENVGPYVLDSPPDQHVVSPLASWLDFQDWQRQQSAFSAMAAIDANHLATLTAVAPSAPPRLVRRILVSPSTLTLLGVPPVAGRFFDSSDSVHGMERFAVLSETLWHQLGTPDLSGQQPIRLDDQDFTVVGVVPDLAVRSLAADERADPAVLTPLAAGNGGEDEAALDYRRNHRNLPWLRVIARLRPGVDMRVAQRELDIVGRRLAAEYPKTNDNRGVHLVRFSKWRIREVRPLLVMLAAAALLVLASSYANIASAFAAEAAVRRTEVAVRLALGSSRTRLVVAQAGQLGLQAPAGAVLALLVRWGLLFGVDRGARSPVDVSPAVWPTLWLAAVVLLLAVTLSVLGSMVMAWHVDRVDLASVLREGSFSASHARSTQRFRRGVLLLQVCATTALLIASCTVLRSLRQVLNLDLGFARDGWFAVQVRLPRSQFPTELAQRGFFDAAMLRVRALPAVDAVGVAASVPMGETSNSISGDLTVETASNGRVSLQALDAEFVTPGYAAALDIQLRRGRWLTESDYQGGANIVVVNDAFLERYLSSGDPLQAGIRWGARRFSVVGVVQNLRRSGPYEAGAPTAYFLLPALGRTQWAYFVVGSAGLPRGVMDSVLQEVRLVDPTVCLGRVDNGPALIAATTATARRFLTLVGISGVLAFALAASSLGGILTRYIADSRREIAVRVALGATRRHIAGLVWRHVGSAVTLGLGLGVACGLALNRAAASAVEGLPWMDPYSVAAVVGTLVGSALLAVVWAARSQLAAETAGSLRVS